MKIYTRTGDQGDTALFGGGRVAKDHPRVRAYGTVDELNSILGLALLHMVDAKGRERLEQVQHDLFTLGAVLAAPPPEGTRPQPSVPGLPLERVTEMEEWMDEAEGELHPLRQFVLPGGSEGAALLHVARTVCRRAEREVVAMGPSDPRSPDIIRYLNRLSDLLFTMARMENHRAGVGDVLWRKEGPRKGGES